MAERVLQQHVDADVGYHAFALQDSDDAELPVPFPEGFVRGIFLNSFPGRLDLYSAGHTHTASVKVEVWDGRPPPQDPAGWDEQGEAGFASASGQVAVWSMSLGRTEEVITLGSAGSWRVRVSCAGRGQAAALSESAGTGEGVERYLMQFWPTKP